MEKEKKSKVKYIYIHILVILAIIVVITNFLFSAFRIKGDSMNPILFNKERILISRAAIAHKKIHRYDIIALHKPTEPNKSIIKRVIALPQETIEIRHGTIYINKKKIHSRTFHTNYLSDMKPVHLKQDFFFVLGDNVNISIDSRNFGPVHKSYIFGKAIFRYWPISRFGKIK